jgi:hypothetical protein
MLQLESRTFTTRGSQEEVFKTVSDFRELGKILPSELMKNVEAQETECRFDFSGLGRIGLKIDEKKPYSYVAISGTEDTPARFVLKVNLTPLSAQQTQMAFYLEAGLNALLEMMARKPLQDFLDMLADKMEKKDFSQRA